jgi:transcription antitermination factor NusG
MTTQDVTHATTPSELSQPSQLFQTSRIGPGWFTVHTEPNRERWARDNLQREGFEIFLPLAERTLRHGRRQWIERRPIVAGFVWARFDPADKLWGPILHTPGVIGLLRVCGGALLRLSDTEVAWVRALDRPLDGVPKKLVHKYEPDTLVRVIEGVLAPLAPTGRISDRGHDRDGEPWYEVEGLIMFGRPLRPVRFYRKGA